ncbi:MAG: tRNA uridine-5-carboxymethylaminomethyl(34) synthesis GTPase MnmE [Candidatus Ancaeobacter aquaticus]|nr:tRNA uridine-5-carboxymethylaminomethyl(34) synthesis GTPase MnmE [Candidatus Ancaeobacter aquaticus]
MSIRDTEKNVTEDTIAAISTAMGIGAIGMVRISGSKALHIADKIFTSSDRQKPSKTPSHRILHGHICANKATIDEVLVTVMRAPHTYTREDVIEISGHGGMLSLRKILEEIIRHGARMATAGEFTKRAFLNGRLDLSQAEAVVDVINAETEYGLELAVNHLKGELSTHILKLKNDILDFYCPLEVAIDFPEEGIIGYSQSDVKKRINKAIKGLKALIETRNDGRKVRSGIDVVIAGATNVGKSSLFNLLIKEDKSIVTHVHGTTRNVLEDVVVLDGMLYKIADTAGLRKTKGVVERIGIKQTEKKVVEADVILYIIDNNKGPTRDDKLFLKNANKKKIIIVINKIDLKRHKDIKKIVKEYTCIEISAKKHIGTENVINELVRRGKKHIPQKKIIKNTFIINERQYEALVKAQTSLQNAQKALTKKLSYEFIAFDIKNTMQALGEITGDDITEETLHAIFSRFCIGK